MLIGINPAIFPMRYLTKSKFKLGRECATKLFYSGKAEYASSKIEDSFLRALADGGFQVGALARCYFPGGILIETPNDEAAATATEQYLQSDRVTLFEAVFKYENFLIRADIVVKDGTRLNLYEVKAKSCNFADEGGMLNKDGGISSTWQPYIEDVAFQKHVLTLARPDLTVGAHLMLADKTIVAQTDGLNQKFKLIREEGRRRVRIADTLTAADLAPQLLRAINVDETCDKFFAALIEDRRFDDYAAMLADRYNRDEKIVSGPRAICKKCEFRIAEYEAGGTLLCGYRECWSKSLGWTDPDFEESTILDVWMLHASKKKKLFDQGRIKLSQVTIADLTMKSDPPGMSASDRQWLQIEKCQNNDNTAFTDIDNLRREMLPWKFPLHFIDFETCKPVIPFLKGHRPYEEVVFQFSHHTVDEAGAVRHAGEFLMTTPGAYPNFDFVRELKRQLCADTGTIFKYTQFENTVLGSIRSKLLENAEHIPDADELCQFIESIAKPTGKQMGAWEPGPRNMVDLYELVKRYHYDPATKGSISLKFVLPAMLNSSKHLQERYSQPIYGGDGEIHSENFPEQVWIQYGDDGRVIDPYKLLPPLFTDESDADYAALMDMDKLADGGAAMTAYAKLQFEEIPADARRQMESALLKYCELDTLAMVMIYEAWKAEV